MLNNFLSPKRECELDKFGWILSSTCALLVFVDYTLSEKFLFAASFIALILMINKKGWSSPFLWFLMVGVTIQLLSWFSMRLDGLYLDFSGPKIYTLTRPVLCLGLLVYLYKGNNRGVQFFLYVTLGLLYVLFLRQGAYQQWLDAFHGLRSNWGVYSVADISLFSAISLLYLLMFSLSKKNDASNKIFYFLRALSLLGGILFLTLIALGQMRGIWLALVVALIFSALLLWLSVGKDVVRRHSLGLIFFSVALFGVMSWGPIPTLIKNRILAENYAISMIAEGRWDDVPLTSVGIRINIWRDGLGYISERPFLGWHYTKLRNIKISEAKYSHVKYPQKFSHFHNGYIDMLFLYGISGFIYILVLAMCILWYCYTLLMKGCLENWRFLFGCSCFIVLLVGDFTDPYITYSSGSFVIVTVMMLCLNSSFKESSLRLHKS